MIFTYLCTQYVHIRTRTRTHIHTFVCVCVCVCVCVRARVFSLFDFMRVLNTHRHTDTCTNSHPRAFMCIHTKTDTSKHVHAYAKKYKTTHVQIISLFFTCKCIYICVYTLKHKGTNMLACTYRHTHTLSSVARMFNPAKITHTHTHIYIQGLHTPSQNSPTRPQLNVHSSITSEGNPLYFSTIFSNRRKTPSVCSNHNTMDLTKSESGMRLRGGGTPNAQTPELLHMTIMGVVCGTVLVLNEMKLVCVCVCVCDCVSVLVLNELKLVRMCVCVCVSVLVLNEMKLVCMCVCVSV